MTLLLIAITDYLHLIAVVMPFFISTIHDEVNSPMALDMLLLLKKRKKRDQRKTTSFTVVCNRHSPKPEDYFLSMLRK